MHYGARASAAPRIRLVDWFDGFIFVFPQYDWDYPAVLKNAAGFPLAEWREKPAERFCRSAHGGGSVAAEQFRVVMVGLGHRGLDRL